MSGTDKSGWQSRAYHRLPRAERSHVRTRSTSMATSSSAFGTTGTIPINNSDFPPMAVGRPRWRRLPRVPGHQADAADPARSGQSSVVSVIALASAFFPV
jgi:hypothetical protein